MLWRRAKLRPWTEARIENAIDASYGSADEHLLWTMLNRHWDQCFAALLIDRMVTGAPQTDVRHSALDRLADRIPASMPDIVARIATKGDEGRLAQLASEIAQRATRIGLHGKNCDESALALISAFKKLLKFLE